MWKVEHLQLSGLTATSAKHACVLATAVALSFDGLSSIMKVEAEYLSLLKLKAVLSLKGLRLSD